MKKKHGLRIVMNSQNIGISKKSINRQGQIHGLLSLGDV